MRSITFIAVFPALLAAEVLSDRSLNGKYHFVHLQVGASRTGHVTNVNSAGGTIVFNGGGNVHGHGKTGSRPLGCRGVLDQRHVCDIVRRQSAIFRHRRA